MLKKINVCMNRVAVLRIALKGASFEDAVLELGLQGLCDEVCDDLLVAREELTNIG